MPAKPAPSPLLTAIGFAVILVVAVAVQLAGLPSWLTALVAGGAASALLVAHQSARREAGARAQAGPDVDRYPVRVPAERVAVGKLIQQRLWGPTAKVWAPGLLCLAPGQARFVPSDERRAERAWWGPVERTEVLRVHGRATAVRVHGAQGAAQFVVQLPIDEVRPAVAQVLPVDA